MASSSTPRPWTAQEDALLRHAVAEHGDEPGAWKAIASCVPGRSNKGCRKTPWTPAEDALLLKLYATHSPPRWSLIAKSIPGRTDDACSKRYREALDPLLKKDGWTSDEDAKLIRLTAQLGSKWTQVGQQMSRSGLGCRNRWRLLERKRRSRHSHAFVPHPHDDYTALHLPDHSIPTSSAPSVPDHPDSTPQVHATSFSEGVPIAPPLTRPPPFSGALADTLLESPASASINPQHISTPHSPPLHDPPQPPFHPSSTLPDTHNTENSGSRPVVLSEPPQDPWADPAPASPVPDEVPDEVRSSVPPRKRPRLRGGPATEQGLTELTRLSSHLPADHDRAVLAYACGHTSCWPGSTGRGDSCFATASELAGHRRLAHPVDQSPSESGKAYRCALQGCGKAWKNINGIQYHLQVSKAHFKTALSQTRMPSDAAAAPAEGDTETDATLTRKRKEYRCHLDGCTNSYKQRTGLQYHLAHGHSANVAQLDVIPPALMRKLNEGVSEH
ncbi:hypothetical protein JB92DRAFT_2981456 [Gautieria morchelliformis]|nr:hypothetical protein JB92DRAFT_2981456 [Gautieria morchelliformis]